MCARDEAQGFEGDSVELDAIPPDKLQELAEDCITRHIDKYTWKLSRMIESQEQEALQEIVDNLGEDIL